MPTVVATGDPPSGHHGCEKGATVEQGNPKTDKAVRSEPDVWLRLEGLPRSQWGYPIKTEAQTIGRSPGCHIRVGDPTVSREHAVLWLKEGVPYIRDLDSIN